MSGQTCNTYSKGTAKYSTGRLHTLMHLSRVMRKSAFCIYAKTKAQICFAVTAKLISAFVFRYIDSTTPLLPEIGNRKPLTIL